MKTFIKCLQNSDQTNPLHYKFVQNGPFDLVGTISCRDRTAVWNVTLHSYPQEMMPDLLLHNLTCNTFVKYLIVSNGIVHFAYSTYGYLQLSQILIIGRYKVPIVTPKEVGKENL